MDAIVKYDKNYWDQFMYQLSEIGIGIVSVGESALRFTLALGLGLTSAGASLFGADEYAENTKNAAEGWLSESWAQQMREGAQNTFNAVSYTHLDVYKRQCVFRPILYTVMTSFIGFESLRWLQKKPLYR